MRFAVASPGDPTLSITHTGHILLPAAHTEIRMTETRLRPVDRRACRFVVSKSHPIALTKSPKKSMTRYDRSSVTLAMKSELHGASVTQVPADATRSRQSLHPAPIKVAAHLSQPQSPSAGAAAAGCWGCCSRLLRLPRPLRLLLLCGFAAAAAAAPAAAAVTVTAVAAAAAAATEAAIVAAAVAAAAAAAAAALQLQRLRLPRLRAA